jgi:AcrR family transcriptional regulator
MIPAVKPVRIKSEPFSSWLGKNNDHLSKGARTRITLLQTGAHYLSENSLDSLTVSAICQQAGVAHGTFYLYFKDRNGLVGDLLSMFVDYLQIQMRASAKQAGDPVRNTTAAYFLLFKAHAGLMKCLVMGFNAFPKAQTAFQRLNNDWAKTVVRVHSKNHRNDQATEDELMRRAYALGGMVDQYLSALFVAKDPWLGAISQDPDTVINTLTNLWTKGMQE